MVEARFPLQRRERFEQGLTQRAFRIGVHPWNPFDGSISGVDARLAPVLYRWLVPFPGR